MKKSDLKEDLIIKKPQIDPTAFIAKGARIITSRSPTNGADLKLTSPDIDSASILQHTPPV